MEYKNNTIKQMILEIRFPVLLSINSEAPSELQERIREYFPIYNLKIDNSQDFNYDKDSNSFVSNSDSIKRINNYEFITNDGKTKIVLTYNSFSISTIKYENWNNIIRIFEMPLKEFLNIYNINKVDRVGLRYIDVFSKKELNITECMWKDLINNKWIGILANIEENRIKNNWQNYEYFLNEDDSIAKIGIGLGKLNNNDEIVFISDSDFICNINVEAERINDIANSLHINAKNFYDNLILDRLKKALIPIEQ